MGSVYLNNKVFCLVGPSGTGKDAIKERLHVPHIVSYRTRAKRDFEIDGVHGHFVTEETFQQFKDMKLIAAETVYDGHHYFTLWEQFKQLEHHPLMYVIDWPGVETLRETFAQDPYFSPNQIVSIYIGSSERSLRKRMKKQGRPKELIEARMAQLREVDYPSAEKCDYVIENIDNQMSSTIDLINNIILFEQYHQYKQ